MANINNLAEISALLPIHSENGTKQTISAKGLYDFLGLNPSQWSRWYTKNIIGNQFYKENEEWSSVDIESKTQNGRPTQDFEITLDFAKDLSMQARTDKGNDARRYFLECERKALNPILSDSEIMSKALLIAQKTLDRLSLENSELKEQRALDAPKIENHQALLDTNSLFSMDESGKSLGISGRKLKILLKEERFLTQTGNPYQRYIDGKYFALKPVELWNGAIYMQPMVTGKGLDLLASWYKTLNHPMLKKKGLV